MSAEHGDKKKTKQTLTIWRNQQRDYFVHVPRFHPRKSEHGEL